MGDSRPHVYWETSVFVQHFLGTPGTRDHLEGLLQDAELKRIVIVTSFFTAVEIAKSTECPADIYTATQIDSLFGSGYIRPVALERLVSDEARDLVRDHGNMPYQHAIHLATAHRVQLMTSQLVTFHTYVKSMLQLDGAVGGMRISEPVWSGASGQVVMPI